MTLAVYREARKPTPAQLRVLQKVADGYKTAEAAALLGISPRTAASHVTWAMSRTKAHTRSQAIAICLRQGWIE